MRLPLRTSIWAVPVVTAWALWSASSNEIHVINQTGRHIRTLTVEVCGRTHVFAHLSPDGAARTVIARPDHEDIADFSWEFEDGSRGSDFGGYIAWEDVATRFAFVIRPDGSVGEIRD